MRTAHRFPQNTGYTFPVFRSGQRFEKSGRQRSTGQGMAHEIAKLLLEHAGIFLERAEAIKSAIALGMPLVEIEEYLDWLDQVRPRKPVEGLHPDRPEGL
jgi:hypothetical protein